LSTSYSPTRRCLEALQAHSLPTLPLPHPHPRPSTSHSPLAHSIMEGPNSESCMQIANWPPPTSEVTRVQTRPWPKQAGSCKDALVVHLLEPHNSSVTCNKHFILSKWVRINTIFQTSSSFCPLLVATLTLSYASLSPQRTHSVSMWRTSSSSLVR
jgi:hypothetical protein